MNSTAPTPAYGQLPLVFEPNRGQADPRVRFLARGGGCTLYLTEEGAVFAVPGAIPVRMRTRGPRAAKTIDGREPTGGISNYFLGNRRENWHTGIPHYRKVEYTGIYPGVDLVFYGNPQKLEYDFTVAAWADPKAIQLEYEGAESLRLDAHGELVVKTAAGELVQNRPRAYQNIGGQRVEVEAHYQLGGSGQVGFALMKYDKNRPLVIDPVLVYSTYLNGTNDDQGNAIAADTTGNAYMTGTTTSIDFPTANPLQPRYGGGGSDAFVAKISADGTKLLYSTYFGGDNFDHANGIAVDSAGNAYVAGDTYSTNFPLVNPAQPKFGGGIEDAFIAKFSADGSALLYSTYLGGTGLDVGSGIAVDSSGSAYVMGFAGSTDFPTVNPLQPVNHGGGGDAFVAKLSQDGHSLIYCTYLGGSGSDQGKAIAVDPAGNAYVTGSTDSIDFPVMKGVQPMFAGFGGNNTGDAFVSKISADGRTLLYSTYLGGSGDDQGVGIALDFIGNIYVAGTTSSVNFPTTGAVQAGNGGAQAAFVTKISADGGTLLYSTYLGGSGTDRAGGIAVDGTGNAYVTGTTFSSAFPIVNQIQGPSINSGDAFVTKISADGRRLLYSTYLGGTQIDSALGIAVDTGGNAYVTGRTSSVDFPTVNPFQAKKSGGLSAFVSKIADAAGSCTYSVIPTAINSGGAAVTGSLGVVASPGCSWIATSNSNWLVINSGTGSGNGTVTYSLSANIDPAARSAILSVGSQSIPVNQAQYICPFSVAPISQNVPAAGRDFTVTITTDAVCPWVAVSQTPWISFDAGNSQTGPGTAYYSVDSNSSPSPRTGSVILYQASSTGFILTPKLTFSVTQAGTTPTPPFGFVDTPVRGATGLAGAINFTGWAISSNTIAMVSLWREPVNNETPTANGLIFLGNAPQVPGARPDVALAHPGYPNNNYGWGAQILTNELPGTNGQAIGNGTYKLHAIAADPGGLATDIGTTTITANNASSALPFGTIVTPAEGATVSGLVHNFGWAVTPQPNIIPIDGSTITVYIDNVAAGHLVVYNAFRSDIATLFPGLKNSGGGLGRFDFDSTKLSNGIHSISWTAIDSAGHGGGLGSRYFFVQN